jgi:hypothetical protein
MVRMRFLTPNGYYLFFAVAPAAALVRRPA